MINLVKYEILRICAIFLCIFATCKAQEYCGYNAHYENCISVYRLTCYNYSTSVDPWYEFDPCIPGCVCDTGYIRDEITGQCVPPHYCPNIGACPYNTYFEFCKECDGYQTTCDDYGLPDPMYCPNECKSGCFCEEGLVMDTATQSCVPVESCSCPENEYFEPCHEEKWPVCTPGCTCVPGYVYSGSRCVPKPKRSKSRRKHKYH